MNEYQFEEYSSVKGRIIPSISLGIAGGFGVSAGFVKKYDLKDIVGVKLLIDKEKNAVGFKFLKVVENGMVKIKFAPNQGGGYISANAFLIKYDINAKEFNGRYSPVEIGTGADKTYVIELKKHAAKE